MGANIKSIVRGYAIACNYPKIEALLARGLIGINDMAHGYALVGQHDKV